MPLGLIQTAAQSNPAQSAHGAFHRVRSKLLFFVHQNGRQQPAVTIILRQLQGVGSLCPRIEERRHQRFRSQTFMQPLGFKSILRLPRRIKLLLGAVPGRTSRLARLHLPRRGKRSNQHAFGSRNLRLSRCLDRARRPIRSGMFQFLPQHCRVNPELLRYLHGQLIAHNATRHALNMRQQMIDCFDFAFGVPRAKLRARPVNEVIKILLRVLQSRAVCVFSLSPNEQIRIEPSLQRENTDVEFLLYQQTQRALRSARSRRIGIEIDDNVF